MKRKTWLAALLALCLLALPAFTALADETGMESLGEISAEAVDEIIPEPMDEITAEAVDQDIDAVTMDLDDADEQGDADRQGNSDDQGDTDDQSALLPEYTAVEEPTADPAHETTPDGNADAAGDTPVADDTPAAVESGAGDAPASDDAPAESSLEAAPLSDNAPVSGEPAAPAEPLSASLEPETEQFSAAAMLARDGIIGTITDTSIGDIPSQTYTGQEVKPTVTVTVNGNVLQKDRDYTVSYDNNINAGISTATVKVTGTGNYDGEANKTFTINKADRTVTASYTGEVPNKVYDKTRNLPKSFTFKSSDFKFSNVASGDTVALNPDATDSNGKKIFAAGYDGVNVGAHKVNITLAIKYTSTNYNYKLANSSITSDKSGNITPKQLTIKPGVETNGTLVSQTKIYGTADPSSYKAKVAGVLEGDKLADAVSGKLSRQSGENVGKYRITIGTIKTKGNYATDPKLEEAYFEIRPKPITGSDIGIGSIPSQEWTGSAITPDGEIKLRYGTKTLVKGTDYDVKYSNNVDAGTATATIIGKGNYTGTRTVTFKIINAATTSTGSSSDSSGVLEYFPIVTNGKYVVSTNQSIHLNLGNLSARSFKSSNKKVASVDRNGIVTTKRAGKTQITISLNKTTKIKLKLTVIDPTIPTSIALNMRGTVSAKKDESVTLTYTLPEGTQSAVNWKSSNKKVATVKNGVVTFKKPGRVTITCTAKRGKKKARVKFRVSK